ncbi:MAG: GlsB/YeaQ/YmgE family stress response membrane protein [Chloroflexi bacterium]|nr:MAG: GlsB/YeaQ/YmgE family stress response membrane protein [Chloroflexota bacterium]
MDQILIWALVGLVAGFLASHLALGHGLGLFWDIVVGIVGALFGGIVLAGIFHFNIAVAGHPIISAMIMAFIGAAILLIIVRLFSGRGARRRAF